MGDDNVGMTTTWARNDKGDFQDAYRARASQVRTTDARSITAASQVMYDCVMANGWADHMGDVHPMNFKQMWMSDVMNSINKADFEKRRFAGNSGYCRFMRPYMDAHDTAFIAGADYVDSAIAGFKGMMDFYGVDAPFWAWWV